MNRDDSPPFFIPHLRDDPSAAEVEWLRYLAATSSPASSRRTFELRYRHDGDEYLVRVGERRQRFGRKTGPRGGYIKNATLQSWGVDTGSIVSGIVDTGSVLYVWSYEPFGGWANPSMVGQSEVITIIHFAATEVINRE